MNAHTITAEQIARYGEHLREEERAPVPSKTICEM